MGCRPYSTDACALSSSTKIHEQARSSEFGPLIVEINGTDTGRFKDVERWPARGKAGMVVLSVESLFYFLRLACESDYRPSHPLFSEKPCFPGAFTLSLTAKPSLLTMDLGGRLGRKRFTRNNYEAATEIGRSGTQSSILSSLHLSFKYAWYNYAINLAL